MGGCFSQKPSYFRDIYNSIEEVQDALQKSGMESSNLIIGIDYTKSNETQGKKTFGGKSLHSMSEDLYNPYQKVIQIIGRTLSKFDEDQLIPSFGFGDLLTKDHSVFPFLPDPVSPRFCHGFKEVLEVYNKITPSIKLSGPTNFAPVINKAIEIVSAASRYEYHILVIVADGMVVQEHDTIEAIKKASEYPISIIVVGVGDGPWEQMEYFDDLIPKRKFDNFQFVNYHKVMENAKKKGKDPDSSFALHALMEIPQQYEAIKKLGLMKSTNKSGQTRTSYVIEGLSKNNALIKNNNTGNNMGLFSVPFGNDIQPSYNPYQV